ncbi:DUF1800 domain-containing protein [Sphingomonas panacisoli]|uniref:DUF1800 domain-containing protein n=1 Tax=Sphingomonas panacisoli TaxID=1813879 RepID=A0A5B8LL86_9SPHN|nr:DUF1800 family protein [Sphingomonas panacisoli]QDZ08334.1 DUF1800 domain-containing protein [Sphingomonas panacisoli]
MDTLLFDTSGAGLDDDHLQDDVIPVADRLQTVTVLASALALAACGDGGGGSTGSAGTPTPPPVVVTPLTESQASRFLGQATMGATRTTIDGLISRGIDGWLTDQFAMARATTHYDWLVANGYNAAANINSQNGFDTTMWRQLIVEPDQLRQRVGMALLDMLVVGIGGVNTSWVQFSTAAYVDVLLNNAFGNFRDIMDGITTNVAMGSFLTFLGNRKANTASGSEPDENYARELMQLFTIGLYQLNMDGTLVQSGGNPVETYKPADVSGLARVFTGLNYSSSDNTTPDRMKAPMTMQASINETGTASFLGTSTSGGGMAAIKVALDTIFAHANVPPFVSKQLIQRLVTSNPSPAYVGRVSAAFANNGAGVRGDMKAVIKAILTDSEARDDTALTAANAGKIREPIMRLTGWARAFGVNSPANTWPFGDTSSTSTRIGQSPGRSPSVFNFFRPGYSPPATAISAAGLVAPEFQITNEQSVVAYINYFQSIVANGAGDAKPDYTTILTKASDSAALVAEVNTVLAAGQLSTATQASIKTAVDSISATATNGPINRVGVAILLTLASPDFLTVK